MEVDTTMTDLVPNIITTYFQELLDPLLEQIFRDFDESFNGRCDTAILRTVCKNFRRIIDTSIPYFCLYKTLTDAIKQHNEDPFSSPWLTSYQSNIHSVLFAPKPILRNLNEERDLPEDPKDEPLLALEILLSTIRAEKYIQHHYPSLAPYIEVIYMPFIEDYHTILEWSCFVLTIPNKARKFGGKKIMMQYKEQSVYIHVEDQELAKYLGLGFLDVLIQPNHGEFGAPRTFEEFSLRDMENKIAKLLDADLEAEFMQKAPPSLSGKINPCKDKSTKLLKYSPKSLIAALPTLPRALYLLVTDQNGDFWNNLYSCYDLIDRFRTNAIHRTAIAHLVSFKYENSEVGELVNILCRSAEFLTPDRVYFYTPKAEKIVLFSLNSKSMAYYYRYDELEKVKHLPIVDKIDEDIAILSLQKELNFPRLLTPEQFMYIVQDFSDLNYKDQAVNLPFPPPLREGAKNLLKNSFNFVDPSAQMKSATVYFEENNFTDAKTSNNNMNKSNQLIYSSCRTSPSLISDKDSYSLAQILQVDHGDKKEFYFHLRIGHLTATRHNDEHFVYTMKASLEEAKASFDLWSRYFTKKGLHFVTEPETFKTVLHIERLPYYPEMIQKGEPFDPSLAQELLQLFPSARTYLIQAEIIERQDGPKNAIKVIDEAFEYGTKFRGYKSIQLWNKKIELFIKSKEPVNAFLTYIMSCHYTVPRKFPEDLYEQMMVQLERDEEYEMEISADHLILSQVFKSANIALNHNREAMQHVFLNELVQESKLNCKNPHPDILPIKEIFDILSKDVRIEFLPSGHEERKMITDISKFGDSRLKPTDEFAVWKVHSKFTTADPHQNNNANSKDWYWTELRQPLWLPMLLAKGEFPKPRVDLFISKHLSSSTFSMFCELDKSWIHGKSSLAVIENGRIVPMKYIVLNNSEKRDESNADVLVRFLNLLDSRSTKVSGQFIAACCTYFDQYASFRTNKPRI